MPARTCATRVVWAAGAIASRIAGTVAKIDVTSARIVAIDDAENEERRTKNEERRAEMIPGARYVHTNLIARDWRRLARFYEDVFGCVPVPPERDLSGAEMEAGTGVPAAHLRGMHLRLPGTGPGGPTLEIFEYSEPAADLPRVVNRPGFAHIAFAVDSVADAREQVLSNGGTPVGEVVTVRISETARVTWCYVKDPEGNVIELQHHASSQ